ncbi:helix-turn-helix domain-containing protein [Paenibacillus alvei]|uniref:Helix-turn-helix transcriptional regulator n=1 Tax=Paenibacillus alvei TaxID=44250 RepID=A0AAP7A0S6_PAEAL|nr:helix-turn-helix transcriptional regulator [Paenibacillus alvei]NOJ73560.1 helix-turn-helix transcriptional regulator [Paenibacillus alvei]
MSVLGERIKSMRTSRKWTQGELATKIGTTKQVISNWERSKANPDPGQIITLANTFNVSSDYLLGISNFHVPHFSDPFDQQSIYTDIDNSFVKVKGFDLVNLINSDTPLTIGNYEINPNDKKMLTSIIEITLSRIIEVQEETLKSHLRMNEVSQLF